MSGDSINYGDTVNMYGGTGNTGMVKNSAPAAALDPQLRSAIEALIEQLRELREQVPPLTARTIDESLPVLAPDAAVPVQARTRALMAVAGGSGPPPGRGGGGGGPPPPPGRWACRSWKR
jgi:hypothetical protein